MSRSNNSHTKEGILKTKGLRNESNSYLEKKMKSMGITFINRFNAHMFSFEITNKPSNESD